MDAFHSYWSRPSKVIHWDEIVLQDQDLLTMMLSALKWREKNGSIRMITDTPGAEYFERAGLTGLWDCVTTALDHVPEDLDPYLFWAAGKLYALSSMDCPCVMLDTDLIVWRQLIVPPEWDIVAAHGEELYSDVYPDPSLFLLKEGYSFPKEWDFSLCAANTAFLYIRDPVFRDYYVRQAAAFMRGVEGTGLNPTNAMCTAEQRLLPLCAAEKGKRIAYLLDLDHANSQDFVTHVWGHKQLLKENASLQHDFCVRCTHRILRDFPETEGMLSGHPTLSRYLQEVSP